MEVPDVLVVTKADLGDVALRARRDLNAALRSLGERDKQVVAVSSLPPAKGIDDLVAALDAHREALDLPARRVAARRDSALADFLAEHGERGLRALGGRRAAVKALAGQDPGLDVATLVERLEERAEGGRMTRAALRDAAVAVGALVLVTLLAELLGAENLGTALTFGVIAFMAAIVGTILVRRDERLPGRADEPPGATRSPPAAPGRRPPPPPRKRRRR
jgi:hypothetical protein